MRFLSLTDQKCASSSTFWQFFCYRPPREFRYTAGEFVKCDTKNSTYIYIYRYHPLDNWYGFFYFSSTLDYTTFQDVVFFNVFFFSKVGRSVIGWRRGESCWALWIYGGRVLLGVTTSVLLTDDIINDVTNTDLYKCSHNLKMTITGSWWYLCSFFSYEKYCLIYGGI